MMGIIGGTGLYALEGLNHIRRETVETPYGQPSSDIVIGQIEGREVAFLARHGEQHQYAPHTVNYRANVKALKQLGVEQVLAVNAVGGITEHVQTGVISAPKDIIDYTHGRKHTFFDGIDNPVDHIDFSFPYSQSLRRKILDSAKQIEQPVFDGGVYGCMQGPRLETAAEIRKLQRDGCDIVGMTTMPEAALAREMELEYASLCLTVNPAAGICDRVITMQDIQKVIDSGIGKIQQLIAHIIVTN